MVVIQPSTGTYQMDSHAIAERVSRPTATDDEADALEVWAAGRHFNLDDLLARESVVATGANLDGHLPPSDVEEAILSRLLSRSCSTKANIPAANPIRALYSRSQVMIRNRALPLFAAVWVGLLGAVPSARGDDPPPLPPLKLTIYPSAAAWPSLKYQLLPEFNTRIRGNAAVYYGKVTAESFGFFGNRELLDKIDDWREAPLEALQNDEAAITWSGVLTKLATAAHCESCDWQLPVHEEDYYQILLPEVQQTRQFARILATTARIHIARGEFDDALRTLQSGFALVRNVAEGETIINGLVSIAINGMLYEQLTTFVQQPNAPNLYWALTMLPRPIVSLRKGVEAEIYAFGSSFPEVSRSECQTHAGRMGPSAAAFLADCARPVGRQGPA